MRTYEEYRSAVERYLVDFLPDVDNEAYILRESMEYSLLAGGKRLRPVLLLSSCDFAGGDMGEAIPAACATEYIHTYSLIHDDLPAMDNDELRRGKFTNHKVYGEDIAILAGDALLNAAAETLMGKMIESSGNYEILLRHVQAGEVIMRSSGAEGMVAGQVADVKNQYTDGSDSLLDFIEANKTGRLLAAPVQAGLIIGGADDKVIEDFAKFAHCLGKAFQIADDILDVVGTVEKLGKSIGKDEADNKCSYVAVHGIDGARRKLHELTAEGMRCLGDYGDDARFFIDLLIRLEGRTN